MFQQINHGQQYLNERNGKWLWQTAPTTQNKLQDQDINNDIYHLMHFSQPLMLQY